MRTILCRLAAMTLGLAAGGCEWPRACAPGVADPTTCNATLLSTGDAYQPGPFTVRNFTLEQCELDAPRSAEVFAPREPGEYPLVIFHHGFMARNWWYSEMLTHLASHGFVVLAPQAYPPGVFALLGEPTVAEELESAIAFVEWARGRSAEAAGVGVCAERIGVAGHSRGGSIAFCIAQRRPELVAAVAGVDPVDTTAGRIGLGKSVVGAPLVYDAATLVIGTGGNGDCETPTDFAHGRFFDAAPSPAWHLIATNYAHSDMIDPDVNRRLLPICPLHAQPERMVRFCGGALAGFFRASLQADAGAVVYLEDPTTMEIDVALQSK